MSKSKAQSKINKGIKAKGAIKSIELYKKMIDDDEITEKQKTIFREKIGEIEKREIIDKDPIHIPIEIKVENSDQILAGPTILTRFEKARILGARALQLSLGAPPFTKIPSHARTSLDIAIAELEQRVLPITIKRVLPNGDYQNIPIKYFIS